MLSEVQVDGLLQRAIRSYLASASYTILRSNCLDRTAIAEVVSQCQTELENIATDDKAKISALLTETAYNNQTTQDLEVQKRDLKETAKDENSKLKLRQEQIEIEKKLLSLDGQIQDTEMRISLLQTQIADFTLSIIRLSHPSQSHIPAPEVTPQRHEHPTDHSHPEHATEHGHDDAAPHIHEHSTTETSPILLKKRELETQRARIQNNRNLLIQNKILIINEVKGLAQRKAQIENVLSHELNQKKLARAEREAERTARQQQTQSNAGPEKRLSAENFKALKITIRDKHADIEKQKTSLMQQVDTSCYALFLNFLKESIPSHLRSQEMAALKQIIGNMQEHLKVSTQRSAVEGSLKQLHESLTKDESRLRRLKEECRTLKESNPNLKTETRALEDQNAQLTRNIGQRQEYRNNLLKSGSYAFMFATGAAGATFLALKFLTVIAALIPLLFIPALASGITGLGFLIASLAYTAQNYIDGNQIEENKAAIANNKTKFADQKRLEETIPSLEQQNMDTKADIAKTQQKILDLKDQELLLLGKANAVIVVERVAPSVIAMPVNLPVKIEPSASDLDETEMGYSFTM